MSPFSPHNHVSPRAPRQAADSGWAAAVRSHRARSLAAEKLSTSSSSSSSSFSSAAAASAARTFQGELGTTPAMGARRRPAAGASGRGEGGGRSLSTVFRGGGGGGGGGSGSGRSVAGVKRTIPRLRRDHNDDRGITMRTGDASRGSGDCGAGTGTGAGAATANSRLSPTRRRSPCQDHHRNKPGSSSTMASSQVPPPPSSSSHPPSSSVNMYHYHHHHHRGSGDGGSSGVVARFSRSTPLSFSRSPTPAAVASPPIQQQRQHERCSPSPVRLPLRTNDVVAGGGSHCGKRPREASPTTASRSNGDERTHRRDRHGSGAVGQSNRSVVLGSRADGGGGGSRRSSSDVGSGRALGTSSRRFNWPSAASTATGSRSNGRGGGQGGD